MFIPGIITASLTELVPAQDTFSAEGHPPFGLAIISFVTNKPIRKRSLTEYKSVCTYTTLSLPQIGNIIW